MDEKLVRDTQTPERIAASVYGIYRPNAERISKQSLPFLTLVLAERAREEE